MKNFLFYTILLAAAFIALLAWRKWGVDIQRSVVEVTGGTTNQLRIISTSPNITEILFALGLGSSVAGVTDFCNYPAQAETKPSVGTIMEPDIETILKLNPTNIFVTNTTFHQSLGLKLENMGLRVNVFDVDRMQGIEETILEIGIITGRADESIKLNKDIYSSLEKIRQRSSTIIKKPTVLIVIQPDPLIVAGRNTYVDEIVSIAGGVNAITDTARLYPVINAEMLLLLAPDVIIETRLGEVPRRDDNAISHYKVNIPAVRNKNVFVIDADILSRPGPRVSLAAEQMQQIILMAQETK